MVRQRSVSLHPWNKLIYDVEHRVPNDPISITSSQLNISEDDHIHVVVNTTDSGYYGSTILTNLNTSQTFSYGQLAPTTWRGPTWPAPGSSAEW
jgi:hypothetical protein